MTTANEGSPGRSGEPEVTIDELATRVGMTVRNVRAYASRGLIPPPRLEGRTGYYGEVHARRLQLVRELVDRGYTLAAVEKTLLARPDDTAGHALDLLEVIDAPLRTVEEPEIVSVATLLALSGLERDENLIDRLVELELAERRDDDQLLLRQPTVVRAGTQAIAIGLQPDTVLSMLPVMSEHLRAVANLFVEDVREQIWQPFVEKDMPDEQWDAILRVISVLMPVAGQAVLSVFRRELAEAIAEAMGDELDQLAGPGDSASS
ncbi:MerR family transcriptional regulator [Solicola gregarius]|uniref:MerR family transcriptional regulator n=1 Tax=Solicola gregarius TaxID=2908642 RepID=A0AA46YK39_9ACTN|nr:MerR family transcriptional regulator [Solicola gregarius]UYM04106.1 MerR family transcriptional regulator [Solicola gregarius]